jgi:hypothetical protein
MPKHEIRPITAATGNFTAHEKENNITRCYGALEFTNCVYDETNYFLDQPRLRPAHWFDEEIL